MAAVTISKKLEAFNGSFKELILVLSGTPDTGDTYDTNLDATDGRGADFKAIYEALYVTATGSERVNCTWSNSTGVVTIGTVSSASTTGTLHIVGE